MAAPLDLLLTDAAVGALRRVNPGGSGLRLAAALAGRPRLVAGRGRQLLGELARIAVGTSQVQPSRRDRRFADPGWAGNPLLRRAMQAYLAAALTGALAIGRIRKRAAGRANPYRDHRNVTSDARSPASHAQVRLRIANPDAVCCLTLPVSDESLAALRCGGSEARCA